MDWMFISVLVSVCLCLSVSVCLCVHIHVYHQVLTVFCSTQTRAKLFYTLPVKQHSSAKQTVMTAVPIWMQREGEKGTLFHFSCFKRLKNNNNPQSVKMGAFCIAALSTVPYRTVLFCFVLFACWNGSTHFTCTMRQAGWKKKGGGKMLRKTCGKWLL